MDLWLKYIKDFYTTWKTCTQAGNKIHLLETCVGEKRNPNQTMLWASRLKPPLLHSQPASPPDRHTLSLLRHT